MFDTTTGSARQKLTVQEVAHLKESKSLVTDERRSRPNFFDGRFLAGVDLTREQNYFLTRQADLGKVNGSGVSNGLWVTRGENAANIQVAAGHGITPSGKIVVLPEDLDVSLVNVPEATRLDASFGLREIPRASAQNRTGIFVVALRAVQYTANPIASYPTSLAADRSVEDSDIIEAVAITLVPYSDVGTRVDIDRRRGQLAHEIFVGFDQRQMPADALAIAMVALVGGTVAWVDQYLVRREVGAAHAGAFDFAFASRALREAQLLQYEQHLTDIRESGGVDRFAATDFFRTLPAMGKLPRASLDSATFTQVFFPPEVDVNLALVPADEIPALIEESLMMPPIDLSLEAEFLEGISVSILAAIPRNDLRMLLNSADSATDPNPLLQPRFEISRPLDMSALLSRRPNPSLATVFSLVEVDAPQSSTLTDDQWREIIGGNSAELLPTLWYVRRRDLDVRAAAPSLTIAESPDDDPGGELPDELDQFSDLTETLNDNSIRRLGEIVTDDEHGPLMVELLSSSADSLLLQAGLANDAIVLAAQEQLDANSIGILADRYHDDRVAAGLQKVNDEESELEESEIIGVLAASGAVLRIAEMGNRLEESNLDEFTSELVRVARDHVPIAVASLIDEEERKINDENN